MTTSHYRRHETAPEPDEPPSVRGGQTLPLPGNLVARAYEGALFIETESGAGLQLSILLSVAYAKDLRDFIDKHYGDQPQP